MNDKTMLKKFNFFRVLKKGLGPSREKKTCGKRSGTLPVARKRSILVDETPAKSGGFVPG
jgi:hypothetical protein